MKSAFTVSTSARLTSTADRPTPAEAFDLFPTRIWQARLRELASQVPAWIQAVETLRAQAPAPAGRTNRNGWNSTDQKVLDTPVFAALREVIERQCRYALTQMGEAEPRFGLQSWINIHDRGGFNFLHMHDGCRLSGCFYLQVPEGSGDLVFRDPRPGVLNGFAKGAGANACKDVHLRPDAGLLVMFPHWLEHYVEVHASDTCRITIAFNAIAEPR